MKSIKPGRGPSMMGGVMSIAMGVFGIIWTVVASSVGGGLFALFGVVFIFVAIAQAVYHFKNATGENRYSAFDITDSEEEPDPLNMRYGRPPRQADRTSGAQNSAFCPYCGAPAAGDFDFCNRCGKKLP